MRVPNPAANTIAVFGMPKSPPAPQSKAGLPRMSAGRCYVEPGVKALNRGMRKTPLQIFRNTRDVSEIVIFAVPFGEPCENPEDLAIALRTEDRIGGCETCFVETGISCGTRATVVGEQPCFKVRGDIAARILQQ